MKKAFALFLALCMMFALCACGQTEAPAQPETPAEPQTETPAEAPAETTGWAPNGPVTMIVAYKAGNGTDVTARILAQYAEKYVGQTIVIENVDGWSQIAAAAPDGMTIGFMNLPNFNSSIVKGLGTYTTADFAAICNHVTETSLVLVRADDERFNDIDDLVAYAKENQTVASTNGAQASNHIGAQAFANSAGFKYIDLPQGNTADELTSLLGKEADWCVAKAADIAGRTDVKAITGGGGCQAYFKMIADETYATYGPASALYSPNMVEDAIETAIKVMNGETVESVVVIPTTIVSADNVADYLDANNTVY